MSKMIRIQNVPNELHRKPKARATSAGTYLSAYLLGEIRRIAARPTLEQLRQRLALLPRIVPRTPPAKALRADRERR